MSAATRTMFAHRSWTSTERVPIGASPHEAPPHEEGRSLRRLFGQALTSSGSGAIGVNSV